jgi:DNA invertase Pin-like site-specific DNA recombinase
MFHIFSALAEFERDLIRERTMEGLTAARAVTTVVATCFSQDTIDLLISSEQLLEFKRKAATK